MTADPVLSVDDTRPCVGCGMCCNGTLYGLAKVAAGEEARVREAGLSIIKVHEKSYFQQPCLKERCGTCTIYENRFEVCRSFRCALLKRYHASEIGLDEAFEKVAKAKELLAAVVAEDPDAAHADQRRRLRHEHSDLASIADRQVRLEVARRLLAMVALDAYLDKWFRNKNFQLTELEDVPIEGSNS